MVFMCTWQNDWHQFLFSLFISLLLILNKILHYLYRILNFLWLFLLSFIRVKRRSLCRRLGWWKEYRLWVWAFQLSSSAYKVEDIIFCLFRILKLIKLNFERSHILRFCLAPWSFSIDNLTWFWVDCRVKARIVEFLQI